VTELCTSGLPLSTASLRLAVQMVGKMGPNLALFTALPSFHFSSVLFSKTWTASIPALRLVSTLLSTFPAQTVTTTKDEWII
jgi:hypothetical protein